MIYLILCVSIFKMNAPKSEGRGEISEFHFMHIVYRCCRIVEGRPKRRACRSRSGRIRNSGGDMSWPKAIWVVADKWEQCKRFNEKMKTPFLGCCVCAGPELRSYPQVGQVGEQHPAWYYYVGKKWCCCTGWFKRSKAMCLCVQALEILQIWKSVCIYIYKHNSYASAHMRMMVLVVRQFMLL